jgi:streptogramin lyase
MLRRIRRLRVVLFAAGVAMLLVSVAQAAPIGMLKQFRIPTANGNPTDITQGSDGNFWFTESHVNPPQTDNHHVGRITPSGAIAADGTVWFSEFGADQLGRLNPATGAIRETAVGPGPNGPRGIAVATDGKVWFTRRFDNNVGFFDPATNAVTTFTLAAGRGPEDIAAAPDGSVWFAQSVSGNIARITSAGVITESKAVKGSEPFGVTVAPNGDPWFTMLSADKIGALLLR